MRFTLVFKAETLATSVEHELVGDALDLKTLSAVFHSLEDKEGKQDTPYKRVLKFLEDDKAKFERLESDDERDGTKLAERERHGRKGKWLDEE